MNCPVCDNVTLREVEKEGILIDVCPSCKGVWLDRGELEKILQGVREVRPVFNQWYEGRDDDDDDDDKRRRRSEYPGAGRDAYPPNAYPNQGYPNQGHPNQGYPNQAYPPQHKQKKKKSVMDLFGDLFE